MDESVVRVGIYERIILMDVLIFIDEFIVIIVFGICSIGLK